MLGSASQDTWQASPAALAPGGSAGGWLGGHHQAPPATHQQPNGKDAPVQQDVLAHLKSQIVEPCRVSLLSSQEAGCLGEEGGKGLELPYREAELASSNT